MLGCPGRFIWFEHILGAMTEVETAHLRLRSFTPDDLDSLAALFSDPEVMRYVGTETGQTVSRAQTAVTLNKYIDYWQKHGIGRLALIHKADVLTAKDKATSKALYTNDTARECAVNKLLSERDGYNDLKASERHIETVKAERNTRLDRLRKEFEIALLDWEAERLGRRNAA